MKTNKKLIKFAAILACLLSLTFSVNAQKRKAPVRRTKPPVAPISTTPPLSTEIKAGAEKVSTQIKNVSRFIYLLGSIAQGIEDVDKDIKAGKATRAAADQNAKVVGSQPQL